MTKPLDVERLRNYRIPQAHDDYDQRDTILYALGVGAGLSEQIDETTFLYERDLQVLPTMALVLGTPGFWPMDSATGLDWISILHGEQRLKIFEPLDSFGTLLGELKVTDVADKGPGNAALVRVTKTLRTPGGTLVAEASEVWVIRGAGGFGGERVMPGEPLPTIPDRDPDFEVVLPTIRTQAAIYRLSGDRNPLHIDPATAVGAGFDRPILHGLATMGVTGRALVHACCASQAARLREIALRFTAPVYPGETIRTHIWQDGAHLHFRADVVERDVRVIDNGYAAIEP
ncbi:MAG: MaoC/PaaZ C-terminal domain-containing protein [Novosphingobium sp.]